MHSSQSSLLTAACEGLIQLAYPFEFSFVYIPILPSALTDFLTAPTPYVPKCLSAPVQNAS